VEYKVKISVSHRDLSIPLQFLDTCGMIKIVNVLVSRVLVVLDKPSDDCAMDGKIIDIGWYVEGREQAMSFQSKAYRAFEVGGWTIEKMSCLPADDDTVVSVGGRPIKWKVGDPS